MKRFRVIAILVCVWMTSGDVSAVLPLCDSAMSCTTVANSQCSGGVGQPCVCLDNFHESADSMGCQADVKPGMTCTVKDSDAECVGGATCLNTTPDSATEVLQCTCNIGFRPTAPPAGGVSTGCEPAVMPSCNVNTLCNSAPNTICTAVNSPCICLDDHHENSDSTGCEPDIEPGGACTMKDSDVECVTDAMCVNTAVEGATEMLNCTCNDGFHPVASQEGPLMCERDFSPGQPCSTADDEEECVDGATCKSSTQVGTSVSVLRCSCNDGYHVVNKMGIVSCARDIIPEETCTMKDNEEECAGDATCINTAPDGATEVLQCTCNNGFHAYVVNDTKSCFEDISPGGTCSEKDSELECVDGAACVTLATDGTTDILQCQCKDDFHLKTATENVSFCEADLSPGIACTRKDNNTECKDGATCVDTAPEGAVTPNLQCVCDDGFHVMEGEGTAACEADLDAGASCTRENSDTECKANAVCRNTAGEGHTADLRCTCNEYYHEESLENSESKSCESDTCQNTMEKCSAPGTDDCSKINSNISCMLSGVCNGTLAEDVRMVTQAISAIKDDITTDCTFQLGVTPTCLERLTLCFNAFLKSELNCLSAADLWTCVDQAVCATEDGAKMKGLARAIYSQVYEELSCACIQAADSCMETQTAAYNNSEDPTAKCAAVKVMFQQCSMTSACDVTKDVDDAKLSSVWGSAMIIAQSSSCNITDAEATTCPLKLMRCGLHYAKGLNSADTKDEKCTSVLDFKECIDASTPPCENNNNNNNRRILHQEFTAAVSAYSCGCVVGISNCWQTFNTSLQAGDDSVCSAIAEYQMCLVLVHCNLTDSVDRARILDAQNGANTTKTNRNCKIAAGTSCSDNLNACADSYVTQMASHVGNAEKCEASEDLIMCARAAKCDVGVETENETLTLSIRSTVFRHQSLNCPAITCSASRAHFATCTATYNMEYTEAGADATKKCIAANTYVECMNGLMCNEYLKADTRTQYQAVVDLKISGCDMKSLKDTNGSPPLTTNGFLLTIAMITATLAARS